MSEQAQIAAVILAAGGSTRLGSPKQLLPLAGSTLLEHVLRSVRDAAVDLRYIVLGSAIAKIRRTVNLTGFDIVENADFRDGQSTSVRAAIHALPEDVAAVIFVLGDQPTQRREVIDALASSYRQQPALAIQPRYADGVGNPVLIDRGLFPKLLTLRGDTGARPILHEMREQIRWIDVSPLRRPSDIDTSEDYEQLQSEFRTGNHSGNT